MITQSFINIAKHGIIVPVSGKVPFKTTGNLTRYCVTNNNNHKELCSSGFSTSHNSNGVVVGSGTSAPTKDDYALEAIISSGISGTVALTSDDNLNTVTRNVTITNTSESDITISEIGSLATQYGASTYGSSSGNIYYVLVDRTLLESPITIPPGEAAVISYTVDATSIFGNLS